jgi:nucleoside-diphosphate-sugar epimerase
LISSKRYGIVYFVNQTLEENTMIVVTTPTGHIGSQVVQNLLAANEAVRVIARDPARLAEDVRARVEIVQGSSDDQGVLMRALDGAESLFLVVLPPLPPTMPWSITFGSPAPRAAPFRARE